MTLTAIERPLIGRMHWPFFGAFMQQTPEAVLALNRLLNAYDFRTIIEIGTHDGGLSTLFALYCFLSKRPAMVPTAGPVSSGSEEPCLHKNYSHHKRSREFYTFDIVVRDVTMIGLLRGLGAHVVLGDTLKNEQVISNICGLIQSPGRTLLLCDGGHKQRELEIYAPALKSGDVVMLHDWARDEAAAVANRVAGIWAGWETRWEHGEREDQKIGIRHICEANGVVPAHAEDFDRAVWFCGIKK